MYLWSHLFYLSSSNKTPCKKPLGFCDCITWTQGINVQNTFVWMTRSKVQSSPVPAGLAPRRPALIGGAGARAWGGPAAQRSQPHWRAMPRFTVHIRDEWLAVPCRETSRTVGWLGQEALKRYIKNKPDNGGITSVKETRFIVRRCQGLGLLDVDDAIEDVLEDNDFVELGKDFFLTSLIPNWNCVWISKDESKKMFQLFSQLLTEIPCLPTSSHALLEFPICILEFEDLSHFQKQISNVCYVTH